MLHPLIHLIATQPELLGSHAAAYGELISSELTEQTQSLKRRTLWGVLAVCFFGVAAVLAGVATLLWAMLVPALQPVPWIVILVPLVPFVLAGGCVFFARKSAGAKDAAFAELRRQVHADMQLLRSMGTS